MSGAGNPGIARPECELAAWAWLVTENRVCGKLQRMSGRSIGQVSAMRASAATVAAEVPTSMRIPRRMVASAVCPARSLCENILAPMAKGRTRHAPPDVTGFVPWRRAALAPFPRRDSDFAHPGRRCFDPAQNIERLARGRPPPPPWRSPPRFAGEDRRRHRHDLDPPPFAGEGDDAERGGEGLAPKPSGVAAA
jgi:hypothetical protein